MPNGAHNANGRPPPRRARPGGPGAGRRAACLLLALAAIAGAGTVAPSARADGDPASDLLLINNVFYPYSPAVSPALSETLNGETAAAARSGFKVKVALIGSRQDLGAYPYLFGSPQRYADLLYEETHQLVDYKLLLTVMPAGYGVRTASRPANLAAARLGEPAGESTDDLARAAIAAVQKLATAAGHPIRNIRGVPAPGAGKGWSPPNGAILAFVAIALAGAILVFRQRRARRPPASPQ
jgi:hypothetical protein